MTSTIPTALARNALIGVLWLVVVTTASCGSGATSPPGGAEQPGQADNTDYDYPWQPPTGNPGVQAFVGTAVNILHSGDCDAAQRYLDEPGQGVGWQGFSNPRDLLLYQAGIELCRDDEAKARQWYDKAAALGWAGTDEPEDICQLYQAVASALEDRPKTAFSCQSGTAPEWTGAPGHYDDPRTRENESTRTPAPESSDEAAGPDSGGTGDGDGADSGGTGGPGEGASPSIGG